MRNRAIGTIVSLLFFALIAWGTMYTHENQEVNEYLEEFERLEVTIHEEKANDLFNEILENSSNYSDSQVYDMLTDTIIPNQEEVVDRIQKFDIDNETMQVHKVYVEAEELELRAFKTIRDGIELGSSEVVNNGFEIYNTAYERFSKFEVLFESMYE